MTLVICASSSCFNNKNIINNQQFQRISEVKKYDHEFCSGLGLDKLSDNSIEKEIYWRCMISLAKNKIITDYISPKNLRNNKSLNDYIENLEKNFQINYEEFNNYQNKFINQKHHKQCVGRGYNIENGNQKEIEDYMKCRFDLIKSFQITPPLHKTQYLKRPQDSYQISYALNKRQDEIIKKFKKAQKEYPKCIKLGINTKSFRYCVEDYSRKNECLRKIDDKLEKKMFQERVSCEIELRQRFPLSLVKRSKNIHKEYQKNTIDKRGISANIQNKNDFLSLGLDQMSLKAFYPNLKEPPKKNTEKKEEVDINNSDGIYSVSQYNDLKHRFLDKCKIKADIIISQFHDNQIKQCKKITRIWLAQ